MNTHIGSMYPNINITGPVVSVLPILPTPWPPQNHIWQFAKHYIGLLLKETEPRTFKGKLFSVPIGNSCLHQIFESWIVKEDYLFREMIDICRKSLEAHHNNGCCLLNLHNNPTLKHNIIKGVINV